MTHTTPTDYAPYEERVLVINDNDEFVDLLRECEKAKAEWPPRRRYTDDTEEMPLTSKLLLLVFAFIMGFFVAMQIGA